MRLVVAVHSREMKTALFLALSGVEVIEIVATANTTAELVTFWRAFRPDVAIVESGLPGWALDETINKLGERTEDGRIFLIDGGEALDLARARPAVEVFKDIDSLIAALPRPTEEAAS